MSKRIRFSDTNSVRRFDSNEIKEDDIVIMNEEEKRNILNKVHGIM